MNIADYIRNMEKKRQEQKKTEERKPKEQNISPEDALNQYSKLSEEELMQELFKVGSVSNGRISPNELDSFYRNVQGFLSPEQNARMRELIAQLKNS